MIGEVVLKCTGIKKNFGETVALNGVDFQLREGEIHGLIGENGSGKSTLSSIISGIHKMDSGLMLYKGIEFEPTSMIESLEAGIGMVVQESGTVANISVAENIYLGETKKFSKFGLVSKKLLYDSSLRALEKIGVNYIDPSSLCLDINYQDRKLIEIAKIMKSNPEILIIDETTTVLSQKGRSLVYSIMDKMVSNGKSVIFITHDLDELMRVCNVITVLRDGNLVESIKKNEFEQETIKQLMVGREIKGDLYRTDYDGNTSGEVVMEVKDIYKGDRVRGISLQLHRGEILGIGGLSHSGMHTLGKCLFGNIPTDSGTIIVNGNHIIKNENSAMASNIGYVSKDRDIEALSLTSSILSNISIVGLDFIKNKYGLLSQKKEREYVKKQIDALSIKCRSINQNVSELSGGNKQKVVFGKWIARDSSILILDCPTRGVDIGVKQSMYQLIYKMKQEGKSIIVISEEMSELIGMCDRIMIMKDGKQSKTFMRDKNLTESQIISSML